jgi:hypothetical protein
MPAVTRQGRKRRQSRFWTDVDCATLAYTLGQMSKHQIYWRRVKDQLREDDGIEYSKTLLDSAIRCEDAWLVDKITLTRPDLIDIHTLAWLCGKLQVVAQPDPVYEILAILARRIAPPDDTSKYTGLHIMCMAVYTRLYTEKGRAIMRILLARGIYPAKSLRCLVSMCWFMRVNGMYKHDGDNLHAVIKLASTIRFQISVLFYFKNKLPTDVTRLLLSVCV